MKRIIYFLVVIVLFMASTNKSQAQCNYSYANPDPAPGTTIQEQELNTYWHYRYRLTHYFMQIGSKVGMSIPANDRGGSSAHGMGNALSWVDGGRLLGWYLMTLATEYRLLAINAQNTDETIKELYYALHAVFSLDSTYMDYWNNHYHGGITSGFSAAAATWPGEGAMPYDDINYYGSYYNDPSNFLSTSHLNSGIPPGTPDFQTGIGEVGPVDLADMYGTGPTTTLASVDNYIAVLIGLDMVIRLVDYQGIGCSGFSNPYSYSATPAQMAQQLGFVLMNYIGNISQWELVTPDGITVGSFQNDWDFTAFAVPLSIISQPVFGVSTSPCCSIIWNNYSSSIAAATCAGPQNLEMASECVAMSNNTGYYSSPCSALNNYGQNTSSLSCTNASTYHTDCTGWDLCYEAIYQVLNGNPCGVTLCDMQKIIDAAPYHAPFCHNASDYSGGGWGSTRRFMQTNAADYGGETGNVGNYNGLDYMVFYNLYCLLSYSTVFPNGTLSPNYPYVEGGPLVGPITNPTDIQYSCSDLNIEQLDVHSASTSGYGVAGGLILQTGVQNEIYFMPQPDNTIHVENGGYLHAIPNLVADCSNNCGDPSSTFYVFQPDPSPDLLGPNGNDQRAGTGNNPPYQKNAEFDTAFSNNALGSFPNPFTTTTTIDFSLPNDEPVSLYIMNSTGQIIAKLINNETYTKGGHVINYNGSNLATGNYMAVLVTKENKKTIKLIKTK